MATNAIYHGHLAGSTDSVQMPSKIFDYGYLKAAASNTGNVYVGSSSDVALVGTTDTNTTTGFELAAGDVLPLDFPGQFNLASLWYICDALTDDLIYFLYRSQ